MFFDNEEVDITKRCKEVLVDLHKMAESKQDVTTMVAYLPQTIGNENFKNKNTFGIDSPKKYADFIFDFPIRKSRSCNNFITIWIILSITSLMLWMKSTL